MGAALTAQMLVNACDNESIDGGIRIESDLEPIGGEGAPVKPATYEGGRFQHGRRWFTEDGVRVVRDILVIDNEPSQANRLEAALEIRRDTLGLPDIVLDLSAAGDLPPHLPGSISIFRFPHRNADAYLRDSVLDGMRFPKSEPGEAIFAATANRADALFAWCPQVLLFGFWQSHLGKKASQAKKARSWTSEIIGVAPAVDDVRRLGVKGDPLNLSVSETITVDENSALDWGFADRGKKLSEVGHGQVPIGDGGALAGVSFRRILQQSTVSFASLRTVRTMSGEPEARALLVALGLVAHVAAFAHPFSLRSGADLRPRSTRWNWVGGANDEELVPLDMVGASELFNECVLLAEAAGLPVGTTWKQHRLTVEPAPNLLQAITKSWPAQ